MSSAFAPDGFYPFEGPSTTGLELIPLSVRYKLDCAEIKLHLPQWQALSLVERAQLTGWHCETAAQILLYRERLQGLLDRRLGVQATPHPLAGDEAWRELSRWPQVVIDQCDAQSVVLPAVVHWAGLSAADRHALFVLGRSRHSQAEFVAAMRLFFSAAV